MADKHEVADALGACIAIFIITFCVASGVFWPISLSCKEK